MLRSPKFLFNGISLLQPREITVTERYVQLRVTLRESCILLFAEAGNTLGASARSCQAEDNSRNGSVTM